MNENRYLFSFTLAEADQLAAYAQDRDQGATAGWYFGNREVFEARHKRILEELDLQRQIPKERKAPNTEGNL